MTRRKILKSIKLRRRRQRIIPLSLPDKIWLQYKKSLEDGSSNSKCMEELAVKTDEIPVSCEKEESVSAVENKQENKCNTEDKEFKLENLIPVSCQREESVSAVENKQENKCNTENKEFKLENLIKNKEKSENILKKLAVKVDNSFVIKYNCFILEEIVNEILGIQKKINNTVNNTKQILTNCSIQTLIQEEKNDSISSHIISADTQLNEIFSLIQKEELILLTLQKTFHQTSLPLAICNNFNIEEIDMQRKSTSTIHKQYEIEILKQNNHKLQKQLQNNKNKLICTEQICKKKIKEKENYILQLKKKLCIMKKRLRIIMEENDQNTIETTVKSTQTQVQQLHNLMMLNNSLMKNILGEQVQNSPFNKSDLEKNKIIKDLNKQIDELKKQNKRKDNDILQLTKTERQTKQQLLVLQKRKKSEDEQNNFKIVQLTSALDNLTRKYDRWLTDKFYQKCHMIMLFEKLRQVELKRNIYTSSDKLEWNESKREIPDNR